MLIHFGLLEQVLKKIKIYFYFFKKTFHYNSEKKQPRIKLEPDVWLDN
jgi:hypothetical protein